MKERERNEPAVALRARPVALVVSDVPQHAVMRHDCAFGAAGRSRGIGLERLRAVGDRGRRDGRGRLGHLLLEGQKPLRALIEAEPLAQRRTARDRQRLAMARRVHHRERAAGLGDDVLEGRRCSAGIERQRDGAGAHRTEEEFDEFSAVSDQHGDALAGRHAEPSQHAGNAVHPRVELPIGRAPLLAAEQIDDRHLVRGARDGLVEEKPEIAPTIDVVHGDQASLAAVMPAD